MRLVGAGREARIAETLEVEQPVVGAGAVDGAGRQELGLEAVGRAPLGEGCGRRDELLIGGRPEPGPDVAVVQRLGRREVEDAHPRGGAGEAVGRQDRRYASLERGCGGTGCRCAGRGGAAVVALVAAAPAGTASAAATSATTIAGAQCRAVRFIPMAPSVGRRRAGLERRHRADCALTLRTARLRVGLYVTRAYRARVPGGWGNDKLASERSRFFGAGRYFRVGLRLRCARVMGNVGARPPCACARLLRGCGRREGRP